MSKILLLLITSLTYAHDFHNVEYIRNYDGDTVTVNIKNVHPLLGEFISIRVKGIDTPEIKGKSACEKRKALEAKALVSELLKDSKNIKLIDASRGKYFRIVAYIWVDGKEIGAELIKAKLAIPYDGGTKRIVDWCNL